MRWTGHVARMEEGKNALMIFRGNLTGKKPLGRQHRWEENILEWILKKLVSIRLIGLIRLTMRIIGEPL